MYVFRYHQDLPDLEDVDINDINLQEVIQDEPVVSAHAIERDGKPNPHNKFV